MLLLRANVLTKGFSGVRIEVAGEELLVAMLRHRIHPVVPSRGSVGASGDLAPLAHLALALIGKGEMFLRRRRLCRKGVGRGRTFAAESYRPRKVSLSLNGTQAMASVGGLSLARAQRVVRLFDLAGAMSLEGLGAPRQRSMRASMRRVHTRVRSPRRRTCAL